jgi:hypothetical protein
MDVEVSVNGVLVGLSAGDVAIAVESTTAVSCLAESSEPKVRVVTGGAPASEVGVWVLRAGMFITTNTTSNTRMIAATTKPTPPTPAKAQDGDVPAPIIARRISATDWKRWSGFRAIALKMTLCI